MSVSRTRPLRSSERRGDFYSCPREACLDDGPTVRDCDAGGPPENQLAAGARKPKSAASAVTREQVVRLERELASLQLQTEAYDETYGIDNLHLTVAKAYLTKLLANARVVRWLAQHKPEYLMSFKRSQSLRASPPRLRAPPKRRGPGPFKRRDRRRRRRVGRIEGDGGSGGEPAQSPLGRTVIWPADSAARTSDKP